MSNLHGTSVLDQHHYTLDNVGNRTQLQETLAQVATGVPGAAHTWDYLTSAEGWTGAAGSGSTLSWVTTDGSPAAGSLESAIAGKSQSASNVWSIDQTWEQLGVPAGATVTNVQLTTIRERTSAWSTPGATNTWGVELRNTSGVTQATLLGTQSESGLESSWSGDLSGTSQSVPPAIQASNATVRLAIVASMSTGAKNQATVTFHFDHVGLLVSYVMNTSYGYDRLYRLTSVNNGATTYTYDPVGNRLTKGATSYAYDRADRILSAGATSDSVDPNGNLTARGSDSFAYDQANRLTSATVGGTTTTYVYDGDGKRVNQTTGSTTTSYAYDVNRSLPDVLTDGTLKYVYGLGLTYAVDSAGNVQVYHTDGLGSIRAITDGNGTLIQTYQTDAFGVPTQAQGTSTQPFQFTGEQRDTTGLIYLRARYYDPALGRFVSRDPLAGSYLAPLSLNRFAYTANNPTTVKDPSGRCAAVNESMAEDKECAGGEAPVGEPGAASGSPEIGRASSKTLADSYTAIRALINGIVQAVRDSYDTLHAGPNARSSVPADGFGPPTADQQEKVDQIGKEYGCHTCGATEPGTSSDRWVADHQPSSAFGSSDQRFYPQCLQCSRRQGGEVAAALRELHRIFSELFGGS